ncbi:MAG: DUF21 domain-containing protein [Planctomycetales bacterium]|nr:DUF21 domain-containing protein [Planctomycetales bacterium]
MNGLLQVAPWLIAMAILVGCSAFFSASEAALFCLRWSERRAMASGNRGQQVAEKLLHDPDRLLSAVLFWNLVINMAYFSVASNVGIRLRDQLDWSEATVGVFAMSSLLLLIFCSEMVPKSIAVLRPKGLAGLFGIPLSVAVRIVDPVMPALRLVNLLSRRLIWPGLKQEPYLEVGDLERAIELSHSDANLVERERLVLQRVIGLSDIRVDEWMRPRRKCRIFRAPVSLADLGPDLTPTGYLLVAEPERDDIVAALDLHDISSIEPDHLERGALPVIYLPWCGKVADALEQMEEKDTDVAAVVNEFGETIGVLTRRDIMEAVLTDRHERGERLLRREPIVETGHNRWHVAGMTNLRRLGRQLGIELPESHHTTIGGVVQEVLERLPQVGDACAWGPFDISVLTHDDHESVLELRRKPDEEIDL